MHMDFIIELYGGEEGYWEVYLKERTIIRHIHLSGRVSRNTLDYDTEESFYKALNTIIKEQSGTLAPAVTYTT